MLINADFTHRVVLHADEIDWIASPSTGVSRRPLDRIGDEVARATTIVRFVPGSAFPEHVHGGGEEFVVLEGVFQDENGDFPAGSYVRNPPTSRHAPASGPGCTIFVKLWQFDPEDRAQIHVDMAAAIGDVDPAAPGVEAVPLFRDAREEVRLLRMNAGAAHSADATGGAEILVLAGAAAEAGEPLRRHSWVRIPLGGRIDLKAGPPGARVWIKTGHLDRIATPATATAGT